MLAAFFSTLLNHLLAQSQWARESLAPHAGKVALFELLPLRIALVVSPDAMLLTAPEGATPATTLRLTPASLLLIVAQGEKAWRNASVEGDTDFASALSRIASNMRWDFEEDLSRVFGDIAAHRMAEIGRSAAAWPKRAATDLAGSAAEYLTEEKHLLVTPLRAAQFVRDVDEVRDAVERLEKRIQLLQRRTGTG